MNAVHFVIVTALVLLVALAVTAGLKLAQDRAENHLDAVSRELRKRQQEQHRNAPMRYCGTCGRELQPPI